MDWTRWMAQVTWVQSNRRLWTIKFIFSLTADLAWHCNGEVHIWNLETN